MPIATICAFLAARCVKIVCPSFVRRLPVICPSLSVTRTIFHVYVFAPPAGNGIPQPRSGGARCIGQGVLGQRTRQAGGLYHQEHWRRGQGALHTISRPRPSTHFPSLEPFTSWPDDATHDGGAIPQGARMAKSRQKMLAKLDTFDTESDDPTVTFTFTNPGMQG